MRCLEFLGIWGVLATGVWGIPFTPYELPKFGESTGEGTGTKLSLKRSIGPAEVHLEIARVQAVNRAFKKFSKRLRYCDVCSD
jgi:hypothetical protein